MSKTTVFVTPGEGQDLAELARALIDLSSHPHEVVWSTRAQAFEVPEETAQAYAEQIGVDPSQLSPADDAGEDGGAGGGGKARTVKAAPRAARARAGAGDGRPRQARARKAQPAKVDDTPADTPPAPATQPAVEGAAGAAAGDTTTGHDASAGGDL